MSILSRPAGRIEGCESLEETSNVVKKLDPFQVQVILDYGVEGKKGEENFEHAADEFIKVIQYAATQPHVPFMSIKPYRV